MEASQEEIHESKMNQVRIVEPGPKLVQMTEKADERENIIRSKRIDPDTFKQEDRVFSEQEGINNLIGFVDEAIKTAEKAGDAQTEERARLFKDNLVFIGETELKKAINGITQHLLEEAQKGKSIVVFSANVRSERYISLRVLEELDQLTESAQELRPAIKITGSAARIAELTKASLGNCLIAVADDFVVSGARIQGFAERVYDSLLKAGFAPDKAAEMIEANVVAIRQRSGENKLTLGTDDETKKDLKVFSYYRIPEYRDSSGKLVVFTGVSFSGAHSSTDYGFEEELERLQNYMEAKGV